MGEDFDSDGPAPLPCGCNAEYWKKVGETKSKQEGGEKVQVWPGKCMNCGEKIDEIWQAEPEKDPWDLIRREIRE